MREVRCKSGIRGHQGRLQDNYEAYEEFLHYSENYGLARRLGFVTAFHAWKANPTIQWSVIPSDFRIAPKRRKKEVEPCFCCRNNPAR